MFLRRICVFELIYIYICKRIYTIKILNIYRKDAWWYYTTYRYNFLTSPWCCRHGRCFLPKVKFPSESTRSTKWLVILQFMWSLFVVFCRDFVKVMYPLKKDECETSLPRNKCIFVIYYHILWYIYIHLELVAFPANLDPLVTSRTSPGFGLSRHEVVLIGTGDQDQKKRLALLKSLETESRSQQKQR